MMNEFPEYIKLKKEKFKKYGVHENVTGVYKKCGLFYNNLIGTPSLPAPTFSINILTHVPDDFEIIKEEDINYEQLFTNKK